MSDISSMVALSSAHVRPATMVQLQNGCFDWLPSFRKEDYVTHESYGAFIHTGKGTMECIGGNAGIPEDLRDVLSYASEQDAEWVVLDRDADEDGSLPTYHSMWNGVIAFGSCKQKGVLSNSDVKPLPLGMGI